MKETFGEFLKNLRVENEMTLTQLGAKLGIDSGALTKIENNKTKLDEKILPKIAKVFLDILNKNYEEIQKIQEQYR